ncbi:MAG: peptidase S15, partial [Desulfuromonadales bacterium]|nr:peptidase S15 [Desulfuromonadales bacterium]NIS41167.1 peptidase S15 [Desulfuromonadales bacterium]
TEWYTSRDDEFTSLRGEVLAVRSLKRGDWSVRTVTRTILTCTTEVFHIHADLDAYLDGQRVFCKTWNRVVPR